ncbi:MAG: hypothetical protein GF401_02945 [Chitinivibrionales bacterium]|nr:hypothetical protein [Chitinivibrionales bacterium]
MKKNLKKRILIVFAVCVGVFAASLYPGYRIAKYAFNRYFDTWGDKLIDLENRGLLSRKYGAAWQDILTGEAMENATNHLFDRDTPQTRDTLRVVDGVFVNDYPSLSIIAELNEIHEYSNTIEIIDRMERQIADIKTDHTRAKFDEFPKTLIDALIAAEDGNFFTNNRGFEFDSFVRAGLRSIFEFFTRFQWRTPRGTSTITQQVSKLFISDIDEEGRRIVSRSVNRKVRELQLAAALRKKYSAEEILEVYLNHCVTSDYGLIGYKDIARGLLGKELDELTDAECIYLARMVKWGRNLPEKIRHQCRIDMDRMAAVLNWDEAKQQAVLAKIDSLDFKTPKRIHTDFGALVDLANEFWLKILEKNGAAEKDLPEMDIIDPNSLIRKKGNAVIQLTIDLPLQKELQEMVDARGYGNDTIITTDVRVGSFGEDITRSTRPVDTLRLIKIMTEEQEFSEPNSEFSTIFKPGDTLVTNIRYRKKGPSSYRRSCFYYARRPIKVDGQYYAYAIMDSKTGELRAYYSRDKIGSRCACLLKNRTPNGSSTAKPIFNALNFDCGIFEPYSKWDDSVEVTEDVPWKREFNYKNGKPVGVIFANSAVRNRGYEVNNHGNIFEGCQYVFEHLATSNNILGAETVYRLNRNLFNKLGGINRNALPLVQYFQRINAFGRIKNKLDLNYITGVRVYKELARIAGVRIDSMEAYGRKVPVSDSLYSVGLGTLELTLYEQLHLFNMLYNNDLIENPTGHPSLIIKQIVVNGDTMGINDTIRRYHPFADVNNLRPTYLGLHKRLTSNKWDGLDEYEVPYNGPVPDTSGLFSMFFRYSDEHYYIESPLANYAKSGTTDDVIRPFNVDAISKKRTNYGMWNAVVRIDMSKLEQDTKEPEIQDLTIACIGECNYGYTGPRDGKTLHKFVSRDLLKKAGTKAPGGFYTQYERYLKKVTPQSEMDCGRNSTTQFASENRDSLENKTFFKKLFRFGDKR